MGSEIIVKNGMYLTMLFLKREERTPRKRGEEIKAKIASPELSTRRARPTSNAFITTSKPR
jgi:hypothetical protein